MSSLSLLSKNAYLSIYVTEHFIYASLAYSHYDENEFEILRDVSLFPINLADDEIFDFWLDYFENLEKLFNWNIFKKTSQTCSLKDFTDKGVGIKGCFVKIVKYHPHYKKLIKSLREFLLDVKVSAIDASRKRNLYRSITSHLEYEDCLFLDLNFNFLNVTRLTKRIEKGGEINFDLLESESSGLDMEEVFNMIVNGRYTPFLRKHINVDFLSNMLANFSVRPVLETDSDLFQDFVRAHIVLQLLKIFNEKSNISKDFGLKMRKNLVWITGNLSKIPNIRKLLISVIDGLQLKGAFDFCIEADGITYTFGPEFAKGVHANHMIFTKDNFLPNLARVLIPETELKAGDRQTVLTGELKKNNESNGAKIPVMSSELREILVREPHDKVFEGEFGKKTFLEGHEKRFTFQCFKDGITYNRIVFDCRFKPITYGPGPKENNLKFNVWFTSESEV
jgi:hypothetical protein